MTCFGDIIGASPNGVFVYSNRYAPRKDKYHIDNGIYYGVAWQCVEFARRYWIQIFKCTFPSVSNAYDLMKLTHATSIKTNKKHNIIVCMNGGNHSPHIGSLLIWSQSKHNKTGHVAVITQKTKKHIYITQQNETEVHRMIPYSSSDGYSIHDPYILGWIYPKILS
jgi:hypothetical protein